MVINLTYEIYFTLIISAAQAYDTQHATKLNSRGARHSVYNSELQYHIPIEYNLDDNYNMDSSTSP